MIKKLFAAAAVLILLFQTVSCKGRPVDMGGAITAVSREEGSGTRSAFCELVGILDDLGHDAIYSGAEITEKTSVMIQSVSGYKRAIGYASLGAMSDRVKAVKVDNVSATVENIKNGAYKISRELSIVFREADLSDAARDFISFVLSEEGQAVVEEYGYVSLKANGEYNSANAKGKISIAGSTSVAPIIEVLCEEYESLNPEVSFEIQQTGSSAGILSTVSGACDIGMSSRALKESERKKLNFAAVALDGIVVVVNHENEIQNLSSEQIRKIYTGEIINWSEIE